MRRMVAILFSFLLLFSLSACEKNDQPEQPQQPLVGAWTAQIDMADSISQLVYTQTGVPTASVRFPVDLQLSIAQDGTYTVTVDQEVLNEQIKNLMNVLWNIVLEQNAAQNHKTTAEAQEALISQGRSKELLTQQLDFASFFCNTFERSGVWKQIDDMLYFAESVETIESAEGYAFSIETNQLTITYETQETEQKTIIFNK